MKHRPQGFLGNGARIPWRKVAAGLVLLLALGVSLGCLFLHEQEVKDFARLDRLAHELLKLSPIRVVVWC